MLLLISNVNSVLNHHRNVYHDLYVMTLDREIDLHWRPHHPQFSDECPAGLMEINLNKINNDNDTHNVEDITCGESKIVIK